MRRVMFAAAVLGVSSLFPGCKEDADQSPTGAASMPATASKCKSGIDRAVKASTMPEATSIYYTECSTLFTQPACHDAWIAAASLPPSEQIPKIADACRKAYCPSFAAFSFEACRDDFAATPASLTKAWPPLFDAILTKEAAAAAPEVSASMLVLYARLKQLEAQAPAAPASAAPSSSAALPPAAPASAAPPIPSGSAAPAPSGSAAPKAPHAKQVKP